MLNNRDFECFLFFFLLKYENWVLEATPLNSALIGIQFILLNVGIKWMNLQSWVREKLYFLLVCVINSSSGTWEKYFMRNICMEMITAQDNFNVLVK